MSDVTTLEAVLKRDRAIVLGGLIGISALTWAYTAYMALDMGKMDMDMSMAMPQMQTWGAMNLLMLFVMWAVMMVAMMVPTAVFLLGYLMAWTGFSALATLAQWGLHSVALLSPHDGEHQSYLWWGVTGGRWRFPMDVAEASLPEALPNPHWFSDYPVA